MAMNWVVLKFGGSSVAEARHWPIIVDLCRNKIAQGNNILLVLSALKNVSNALEALLHQSVAGVHQIAIQRIKEFHSGFAAQLDIDAEPLLDNIFQQLNTFCRKISQLQSISPAYHAKVLACGELLSTTIGAAYLEKYIASSRWLDIRDVLITANAYDKGKVDDWHHYLSAECNFDYSQKKSSDLSRKAQLLVTQGFIAADNNGDTVLLGREGSDTSASYLAAIVGADEIEIWTDVAGFFTTNPRELSTAKQIKKLSYHEARRMANFGAKVLHPRAIKPAELNNIKITVNNISKHLLSGTVIKKQQQTGDEIFALVSRSNITYIKLLEKNAEAQKLLESLGYDVIFKKTDINADNIFSDEIFLRYLNTTSPEPDKNGLRNLLEGIGIKSLIDVTSGLGMITIIGDVKQEWLQRVDDFIIDVVEIDVQNMIRFEHSGRVSVVVPQSNLHHSLALLHQEFIEKNMQSKIFGKSWFELENLSN